MWLVGVYYSVRKEALVMGNQVENRVSQLIRKTIPEIVQCKTGTMK
jgi:3-polyprenyl-4-hydroxybenzoate decarboxylase